MTTTTFGRAVRGGERPTVLGERFAERFAYATSVHEKGQTRRGAPYIAHLLRVAGLVIEDAGSEDEAIAALLHEAAEDQRGRRRLSDIRRRYGDELADDRRVLHRHLRALPPPPWRVRKARYLAHLP